MATGGTFALQVLTNGALTLDGVTTGFITKPNCGTFTLNGVNAVNVAPASGHFPANAPIAWSLNTVGGTPCVGGPYFATTANIADQFTVKCQTAGGNDIMNWCALPASVTVNAANLDLYRGLQGQGSMFLNSP